MRKFVFGGSYTSFVFDPDALAYFAANTAITDDADKLAIDAFYKGLKADGIYSKIKAMYLTKWGSATNDKWNLKDPRDLDTAFRLTFTGGFTHSTSGLTGNAVNAFAITHITPSLNLINNNTSIGVYSRTDTALPYTEIGCSNSFLPILGLSVRNNLSDAFFDGYDFTAHRILRANASGFGFYVGNIKSSTAQEIFKNGSKMGATNTIAQTQTQPSLKITIFARNDSGTAANYSSRQLPFSFIGEGMDDAENANFYNRVQTLMTYFGINV
jgi:hypothetical protein